MFKNLLIIENHGFQEIDSVDYYCEEFDRVKHLKGIDYNGEID